jgi:8-oxo-dGTP diphosphatase
MPIKKQRKYTGRMPAENKTKSAQSPAVNSTSSPLKPQAIMLAGCAIVREGKLLVLFKRKQQNYFLPGGKVEAGESFEAAASREAFEELGCAVALGEKLMTFRFEVNGKLYEEHLFSAELLGEPQVAEPDEFEHLFWLPLQEASNHELSIPVARASEHLCEKQ